MSETSSVVPLQVEPLDREAFAPFGEVIEATATDSRTSYAINSGTTQRFHDLARLDPGPGGRLIVSIFRAQPRRLPLRLEKLERHPFASQAFMPLSTHAYLVVVAPGGERPDEAGLRAFLAQAGQGVNFSRGVWHHPLLALGGESDFLVIDRDRPESNCEENPLARPRSIEHATPIAPDAAGAPRSEATAC